MSSDSHRLVRVGSFALGALVLFAVILVVLGDRQNLFTPKNRYLVRFTSVGGLNTGSSVQLNGVEVGRVEEISLPTATGTPLIDVWIAIDRRYHERIRSDSIARIKTLGLLGDKFLEVTTGSVGAAEVPPRGEIQAAERTNVDELVASGEDLVENILSVSHSLDLVLARIERGEGVIGQLFQPVADGESVATEAMATLRAVRQAAEGVAAGRGPLYRFTQDEALGERLASAVARIDGLLAEVESGPGLLPALLHDEATRERFAATLDRLSAVAVRLEEVTAGLADGDSLAGRLLHDEAWGRELTDELRGFVVALRRVAEKLDQGDGTAARLLNDPSAYEALDDILIGIDESRLLRWLIRNRQGKGIASRYRRERTAAGLPPTPPTEEELR